MNPGQREHTADRLRGFLCSDLAGVVRFTLDPRYPIIIGSDNNGRGRMLRAHRLGDDFKIAGIASRYRRAAGRYVQCRTGRESFLDAEDVADLTDLEKASLTPAAFLIVLEAVRCNFLDRPDFPVDVPHRHEQLVAIDPRTARFDSL